MMDGNMMDGGGGLHYVGPQSPVDMKPEPNLLTPGRFSLYLCPSACLSISNKIFPALTHSILSHSPIPTIPNPYSLPLPHLQVIRPCRMSIPWISFFVTWASKICINSWLTIVSWLSHFLRLVHNSLWVSFFFLSTLCPLKQFIFLWGTWNAQ